MLPLLLSNELSKLLRVGWLVSEAGIYSFIIYIACKVFPNYTEHKATRESL